MNNKVEIYPITKKEIEFLLAGIYSRPIEIKKQILELEKNLVEYKDILDAHIYPNMDYEQPRVKSSPSNNYLDIVLDRSSKDYEIVLAQLDAIVKLEEERSKIIRVQVCFNKLSPIDKQVLNDICILDLSIEDLINKYKKGRTTLFRYKDVALEKIFKLYYLDLTIKEIKESTLTTEQLIKTNS